MHNTNIKRFEDIKRDNQERYDSDIESLQNLSTYVQERSQTITDTERKIITSIGETIHKIQTIR